MMVLMQDLIAGLIEIPKTLFIFFNFLFYWLLPNN
jgi:hypothetical protein